MPDETTTPPIEPSPPPAPPPAPEPPPVEGHPDQLAQIKLAKPAGPSGIRAALDSLPAIPALDGIRANAEHYTTEELIDALSTLPLPEANKAALETRDEIIARLKAGEFRR